MYSPSAAGAGRSPRIVDISVVASAFYPAWSISPGSIFLEYLESVSTTFFGCSCMDYSFRLLFDFVSMCRSRQAHVKSFCGFFFLLRMCVHVHNTMTHSNKRNINQQADWKMLTKKIPTRGTVCTRGTDTFSVLARSFCLIFDTHLSPR